MRFRLMEEEVLKAENIFKVNAQLDLQRWRFQLTPSLARWANKCEQG